ncbi:LOW QUALITY PROTEIN: transcription factor TFIIIB component B'' homolog [Cottoperca gobio]|uniref:LOW QUALITY PROTEIN: transcription factor TFIIIB component B'' homolog n=1 Tax=Cottoperca gobio TaxID=56716 RepID=A0A6J2QPF5_COTGO|nr:LOW QUALITY PROTEIN: transcription factor TFIIIB component B'' homolog [Cottoperca gobio]
MFRRSRFSIRPNVGTTGKTAATPPEAPSENQETNETPKDVSESCAAAAAVSDNKPVVTPSEKPTVPGDGNDQHGEGTSSSAAVQRRKRVSIKPKVAPGRPSTLARTAKTPAKADSETPVEVPGSDLDKPTTSSQTGTSAAPQRLQSPRRRRLSEESKQLKIQPKATLIPSDSSEPSVVPTAEDSPEQTHLPTDCGKEIESTSGSQGKEVKPDKVPLSLPDKEAVEISEKAKTLVSSKSRLSLSAPAFSLSRLLNDPSDLQRLAKARKLRELLKQEIHKEKKIKKAKARAQEYNLDPAKMTMRDLIRYLPLSNPMTSCLEDTVPENETVVPPSPEREKSPVKVKEPDVVPKMASPREEEVAEAEAETEVEAEAEAEAAADEEADEEAEAGEEEDDDGMMVPQVKVAEDGSLIIDEESLTVEVQRAKGPNPAQDRDPIFERGSTTTYSSFRKGTYSKPWSSEETDMFFLAISMVGTDFSMICQLFPHRARSEIKNKFKKEERENSWRIDKAFRDRRKLDIEYFSKLLEKILEVQKNRKKLKSLAEKKSPKKRKRKSKGKKAGRKLSDVEEEDEEEQKECPDLEKEGEKENEDLCNEGGTTDVKPKKKRKRKNASTEEPNDKKNKKGETSNEQDEALMPGDTEAALPEDCPKSDMSEKTESVNEAEDISIKPAKLSRGRAPKPLLPLGRKYGKKPPPPSTKTNDNPSDKEDESVIDGASDKQVNKDASPLRQDDKSANDDISSEEEVATVQPPRPTRYGRLPKPTKTLNYPATEAAHSTESESNYASPAGSTASAARPNPKCTAKRGRSSKLQSAQESKKPKLVTLRASQLEYTDDEDETQGEDEKVEEELHTACSPSRDSTAPVFVPASLRSPQPVISEVEETMEELDILANMPDVLGISQDALCPEASCERAQNETGTAEPCEHQLDLLVDVINFLSPDPTEVSEDESYNEAAQTLLTIGNMAHLSQSAQNLMDIQDHITGTTSVSVNETTQMLEEEITSKPAAQEENSSTPLISATSVDGLTETVTTVKLQNSTTDEDDIPVIKSSDQTISSDMDPNPQLPSSLESSNTSSPQTRRGRLSKVKTKPNLGKASRTAQTKSQPETVTVRTAEESHMDAPDVSQATETLSAAEEAPKVADSSKTLLKDDISCIEVKRTEEPSGTRKSRFQKVKPNLNLAQTSRTVRSKPQTTNDMLEKDSDPSPNPKFHEKIIVEVEAEPTCTTSSEQPSESQSPASDLIPLLDLGTTLTEELSTTEKKETDRGVVGQMESDAVTSHQSASENQNLSEAQFEARREQVTRDKRQTSGSTDKVLMSHVGTTESSCNNSLTSDAAVTESQTGQGSNIDSTPVQESSDLPTPCVTPAEELPVCKIEESEVRSTRQTRMSRVQKVKPNLNLAQASRTVRSKTQTTKDAIEKHSNPTPNLKLDGKTIIEIEAEPTCSTSPEQPSPCPASVLIPLLDLGTTLTEELSTTEKKETDRGVVGQMESDAATSHQSASENQNFSEAQFEPSLEQSTIDSRSTSGSTDEVLRSHVGAMESSYNNQVTSDTAVTELQTGQRSNVDSTPVQESSNLPAPCVTPAEELPVCKIEQSEVRSTRQTRMSRVQKVKPNLNLAQTSRTVRSKPQTTKDPVTPMQLAETHSSPTSRSDSTDEAQPTCSTTPPEKQSQIKSTGTASVSVPSLELCSSHKTTDELSSTEKQNIDVGCGLDSNSEGSGQNVLHRRQRFPKVKPKPNLGSSPRTTQTKLQSSVISKPLEQCHMDTSLTTEQQPVDNNNAQSELELAETDGKHLTSTHCSLRTELISSTLRPAESDKSLDRTSDKGMSFDGVVIASSWVAENQSVLTDSVFENERSEKPAVEGESTGDKMSNNDKVEAGPASQQEKSIKATETNTQPTAVSDVQSSKDGSTESSLEDICPTITQSTPDSKERTETNQTAARSTDDNQSEPTDSPSRKAPQTRRARLIKPKPSLGRSRRPLQPQQVQNTKQAEAEIGTCSGVDGVSERRPDIQEPVEGAIEQCRDQIPSPNVAGSAPGCLAQVRDSCTQDASTSSTQSRPSLTRFPDMRQEPSDADEPFFILSLTEIPVCSSGAAVGSVPEPLPYLHVTDASIEQQSIPGESLGAAGDRPLSNVPVPAMEESGETGLINVKDIGPDPAAYIGSIVGNPVDPHESTTVHPSKGQETIENNDETPPTKQRLMGTRRREPAKLQVKPNITKRKQASKTLAAKKAESISIQTNTPQLSELPGPSVPSKAFDDVVTEPQKGSGHHVDVEKEKRKGKGSLSLVSETNIVAPASDSPPGKAASKSSKFKTPRAAGKKTPPAHVASTSYDVAPTPSPTHSAEDTHSSTTSSTQTEAVVVKTSERSRPCSDQSPSTSPCPAEVSASQQSDCVESSSIEEEPTSVSQYFLSDIFTEVEEG